MMIEIDNQGLHTYIQQYRVAKVDYRGAMPLTRLAWILLDKRSYPPPSTSGGVIFLASSLRVKVESVKFHREAENPSFTSCESKSSDCRKNFCKNGSFNEIRT